MQTLLVEAGIIMLYKVAHFHMDIIIIYSVMYITPYPDNDVMYKTFYVLCAP